MRADRRPGAARSGRTEPAGRTEGSAIRDRAPLPADPSRCPPLPPEALARFDAGCAALGVAELPPATREAILGHLRLLLAWTGAVNLTAIRRPVDAVVGHVLDSLAAVPLVRDAGIRRFVDLGSGGGYPGLPLALALPAERVLLVDSIAKKAAFLRVAAAASMAGLAGGAPPTAAGAGRDGVGAGKASAGAGPAIEVAAERAETLAAERGHRERWPLVTVRAVAALPELVELAFPLLSPGGRLIAWKRASLDEERARALSAARALGGGRLDVLPLPVAIEGLEGHVLVVVTKTGRTGDTWPRPPAERRRTPW